jgi:hypothetical protein
MRKIGKRANFTLKVFFAGVVVFALMVGGCLNPLTFNPDDLPALKVAGEISVDNINSAELNIRNHTRSVDITRVDIVQYRLGKSYSAQDGASPPAETDRLDARVSGSPTAGTQDSVLVRPTGTSVTQDVTVKKYTVKIWYKKAQDFPKELEGKFTDLQNTESEPLELSLDELPRGRCVFHIYRNQNGEMAIDVDSLTDDPDYGDHYYDGDFIMNVKSQAKIDLSGLEVAVNLPPVTIAGQPIEVTFSQELLKAVNAAFGGLAASMDNIATSVNDLSRSVESYRLFGRDTGLLVVMNWSPKPVSVEVPSGNNTFFIGPVSTGDMDGMLLSTKDGNKYSLKVASEGATIQTRNTFVFNQKVSYLHVYVNQGGNIVSDITESSDRPEDAKLGYGRLRVKNRTNIEITNIVFKKRVGVGAGTTYDDSKSFVVQKVGAGTENQYSSVTSDKVEEGNYAVFCSLNDGSVVFDGLDFYMLPDDVAYQTGDNVIEIWPEHIIPPSSTIMYTVVANGGPPAAADSDYYTTTKLVISFGSPVAGGISFVPTSMTSSAGLPVKINDSTYEVEITDPVNESVKFKILGTDIDSSEHQVHVYKKDGGALGFVPVTDVIVLNNERFTKGTPKTIQWKVIPENATNTAALWTLGEADGNLLLANAFGSMPPYGLGVDGKQHSDPEGRLTVRTAWSYDRLNLAVIVYNGKEPGTRNPKFQSVGETVVGVNGTAMSVTIQALYFDPAKDFVKVFRFVSPDLTPPVVPPSPPALTHTYQNVVLNYIGRGAGGNKNYPGGEWSVNLIEVYRRPQYLTTAENTLGNKPIGGGLQHKPVTDKGGGVLTSGDPLKGKTGVWWQPNPMDERKNEFGGTSEGWITGNWGSINESSGVASRMGGMARGLEAQAYPPPGAPDNTKISLKDRMNMAFAYGDGGAYNGYLNNHYGETKQYFWGSVNLGDSSQRGGFSASDWSWLQKASDDGKLNASGEQVALWLPTDVGPLWIRLRMDYSDGTVGYWWKAVGLQEWFVFDPGKPYRKDGNGNVIIDVDLYATPYMTYRTN